jgi:hypothetical protein
LGFFFAFGFGGERTGGGFGGSRPWIGKIKCWEYEAKKEKYVFEFLVFHIS